MIRRRSALQIGWKGAFASNLNNRTTSLSNYHYRPSYPTGISKER